MGRIVAAALLSHHPGLMLPEPVRKAMGRGRDTTLVPGFARVREALDGARPDTLVIFDTHWFTTTEHLVAGADHYRGQYTSDELPGILSDVPYDYPGAPALASAVEAVGRERKIPVLSVKSSAIAQHYPTLNLLHYLHRGEAVMSVGVCQTAEPHNFLAFGSALAEAVARSDARVALLASGGLSHTFHPLDRLRERGSFDPADVFSEANRALDLRVIEHFRRGEHAAVVDLWPEYSKTHPEGFFGHYFQMLGALGGRACHAKGRTMSEYENAVGTGNVHVWFELAGEA
jgi:3,4-dihydroxyphenylacetate 2,3-dioxygenase